MYQLVALYAQPPDRADFDAKYFGEHMPLAAKIPHVKRVECVRSTDGKRPAPYYMVTTITWENAEDFAASMRSPESEAANACLMSFAKELVTFTHGPIIDPATGR